MWDFIEVLGGSLIIKIALFKLGEMFSLITISEVSLFDASNQQIQCS